MSPWSSSNSVGKPPFCNHVLVVKIKGSVWYTIMIIMIIMYLLLKGYANLMTQPTNGNLGHLCRFVMKSHQNPMKIPCFSPEKSPGCCQRCSMAARCSISSWTWNGKNRSKTIWQPIQTEGWRGIQRNSCMDLVEFDGIKTEQATTGVRKIGLIRQHVCICICLHKCLIQLQTTMEKQKKKQKKQKKKQDCKTHGTKKTKKKQDCKTHGTKKTKKTKKNKIARPMKPRILEP